MLSFLTLLVLFSYTLSIASTFNISDYEESCNVLHTSGYGYNSFFHIPKSSIREDGSTFFVFSVMAPSNAHVVLSPGRAASDKDIVYEIVLGAGRNTFTTIRKLRTNFRISNSTASILSSEYLKTFWIHYDKGVIDVGEEGELIPLVHLEDESPLHVNYISFGAWVGVTATWVYDCKNVSSTVKLSEEYEGTRTLDVALFEDYDPFAMPIVDIGEILFITSQADVYYINLDLKKSQLTTHTYFNFVWTDPKLIWDPSDYENVTSLKLNYGQIWQPKFLNVNSAKDASVTIKKIASWITVQSNGKVQWSPTVELVSTCGNIDVTSQWPWDSYTCDVRLAFLPYANAVNFNLSETILRPKPKTIGNEWNLREILISLDKAKKEEVPFENKSNILMLSISLNRNLSPSLYVFVIPIICATIVSQLCFVLRPDCPTRMYLHLVSLLIFTIYLLAVISRIPTYNVSSPFVVTFTSRLFALAAIQTILSAFIMNLAKSNEENLPSLRIRRVLGNKNIRILFLLPEDGLYDELEVTSNSAGKKIQESWLLCSMVLDRIILFISSLIIAVPVIFNYC